MGSGKKGAARPDPRGAVPDPVILEFRFRPAETGEDSTTEDAHQKDLTARADLARSLNASIYKAGLSLADQSDEEFELTFYCACGCLGEVRRSLPEYVRRGAVIVGHSRPRAVGPPPDPRDE